MKVMVFLFRPPKKCCSEFELEKIEVFGDDLCKIASIPCASILLVISGSGVLTNSNNNETLECSIGDTIFLAADHSFSMKLNETPFIAFRAHVNLES